MRTKQEYLIRYKDGNLYCELADIWIDPSKPVKRALITHAHFDHFTFGCEEYISTKETAILLKERVGDNIKIKTFEYGEEFKINGINISFHPSGHILGSSQIRFIFAEEKWLISGDFKLQKDETCKQYEIVKTDYLISECTFGLPIFKWDEANKIANDISKWITNSPEKTSLLFCYSLGKAQRLLNEISQTNFKGNIYSHGSIYKMNNCYKELSQVVEVAPLYYYYAPNSFTPNGDMMNDTFSPSVIGIETYELFIFDRWGKQVFYSNDINQKWDGTFESNDAQNGTYNFKVLVKKYFDDIIYQEYGVVTLLR